jgi:predicted transcriptional regulator
MQGHPNRGCPSERTSPREQDPDLQRAILQTLIEEPSDDGLDLATLAGKLDRTPDEVAQTIDVLVSAGLVHRRGTLVRATGASLHFDELWRMLR